MRESSTTFEIETYERCKRHAYRPRDAKGFISFIDVLDAQRQLSQVQAQFVQAQTQVETDLVALYKALGGGWQSAA